MLSDFDYDVMQKKRIASNARHRVCGSKSKFCGLPSDHLTPAQWRKRNGEVKTMNLNQPMSWQAFKDMPNDLQKEYIQKCVDTFGCSMHDLSLLFRVHPVTIIRNFNLMGIDMSVFKRGKRMTKESQEKFNAWRTAQPIMDEPVADETPPANNCKANALSKCSRLDMVFKGDINYIDVMNTLYQFADGGPIRLRVVADREVPNEQV